MNQSENKEPISKGGDQSEVASSDVQTLDLGSILGAHKMVRISHDGEIYTHRITRNNRLILTK